MQPLSVIIVEKNGNLKPLTIKEFKEDELFKKCGFKKPDGFKKQTEWNVKCSGNKYVASVYAKDDGRANNENKYDFPPPIDSKLFFGNCVVVAQLKTDEVKSKLVFTNLSQELWEKMYEKLFGGFEDLAATALEDENEEDELANIPKHKKTKQGYLKDGFVVDSSEASDGSSEIYDTEDEDEDEEDDDDCKCEKEKEKEKDKDTEQDEDGIIEDIGSELSEDKYDYSTDESSN
jgi:hypothetical protein